MRSALRHLGITFVVTWTCFIAGGLVPRAGVAAALRWPLLILGAFAPSIVAIALTWREEGRAGARALLARLGHWHVGGRWYAFALLFMAAIKLAVAALLRVGSGHWPAFGHGSIGALLATAIVATIFGGPLGEEIGWRGYVLPRLSARLGDARASVLLGVVWALWHLPVFFIPGLDQSGQSLWTYVPQVVAISVAMAWLYRGTRGSLLLAVLMHGAINQSKDLVSSAVRGATNPLLPSTSPAAWATVALLWLVAAGLLVRMSRPSRTVSAEAGVGAAVELA